MITVKVYGSLKTALGGKFEHSFKNCYNFKQLLTALDVNYRSFSKYLLEDTKRPFQVLVNGKTNITKENIAMQNFKDGDEVAIVPVVEGMGDDWGSVLTIIIAVVLIYFGYYGSDYGIGSGMSSAMMSAGVNMGIAGLSQLLFKPDVVNPSTYDNKDKTKANYSFSGATNLISQGNAVPVGYGRLRVGSQVIGAGLMAVNI